MMNWYVGRKLGLPTWAKVVNHAYGKTKKVSLVIEADPAEFYPEWLALLEVKKPDQYWLEVAYQCAKMDLQAALQGTKYDPRSCGKSAEFHFLNRPEWALRSHPKGRGIGPATKGGEAREHYKRIRGFIPFT